MNVIVVRRSQDWSTRYQSFRTLPRSTAGSRPDLRFRMGQLEKTPRSARLHFVAAGLVCLFVLNCQTACAQDVTDASDNAATSSARENENADVGETAVQSGCCPAIGTPCTPNYWIVSSRHCAQSHVRCAASCHFEFVHVNGVCSIHRSTHEGFLASLAPGVPVCVVAHGSFVAVPDVEIDWLNTYRWIRSAAPDYPLHVVFYTWPSEGPITMIAPIDLAILGRRGAFNGLYLARFLNSIPPDHSIGLIGHSHGTRIVSSALHVLGGGAVQGEFLCQPPSSRRIRAVFAAAAIDHNWLNPGERYGRALCSVECLLNLRNQMDVALAFYPLRKPFSHRALARAGFTRKDRCRQGWLNAKVAEMDVTAAVGPGHTWPNYYRNPSIACLIAPYLYFFDAYETVQKSPQESAGTDEPP